MSQPCQPEARCSPSCDITCQPFVAPAAPPAASDTPKDTLGSDTPRPAENGFTLIELLVSMSILALIMGLVALGVQVMSDGWERGAETAETHDMVGRTSDLLHRDLSGARRFIIPRGNQPTFLFAGTSDTMTYIVREPPYPTAPGLFVIRLSAAPMRLGSTKAGTTTGLALTRSRQPYQSGQNQSQLSVSELTSGDVLSEAVPLLGVNVPFAFAYLGDQPADRWQSEWTSQRRMPSLVRISIGPLPHGGATPEIIVRLKVDAEPGCVGSQLPICTIQSKGELLAISPANTSPAAIEKTGQRSAAPPPTGSNR